MTLDVKFLSGCGTYTLLLFVSKDVTVTVGRLDKHKFPRGYYSYTGSALGKGATCLKNRVARHLKKEKRCFWHIDYLLADQNVSVEAVVATETHQKMECNTNQHIKSTMDAEVRLGGLGLLIAAKTVKATCCTLETKKRWTGWFRKMLSISGRRLVLFRCRCFVDVV